ncbi:hypothetical protein AVEN_65334-1 [Araneus ventricosus]|uniref:Uncharacterized protein n=1 Tax=Araneus ventricosus TaxID=182803 RepID=A0A4Y2AGE5_ARAVE|nr:hypothetical protein AVEN_65334-1 [Araneus ventricosus]
MGPGFDSLISGLGVYFGIPGWVGFRCKRAEPNPTPNPTGGTRIDPNGKLSTSELKGFQIRNPIPFKIRRVLGLLHVKSYVGVKGSPAGLLRKFREGVPAQASSSSSERGSKLRGPSQNSSSVASKRDVNVNKLN